MKFRSALAISLTVVLAASSTAFASDADRTGSGSAGTAATPIATAVANVAASESAPIVLSKFSQGPSRPPVLTTLYGTYATLQVLDLVSTRKALATGAREQNPLMGSGRTGQMIAMKAATGAMSIFFAERAWKKNKVGGIVLMAVINGASAAIVAHNMRNAHR